MKWAVFWLLCALLCGCGGQKNEGIPVVELSKAKGEIDLKLSDLLENIRVIPLETRPDALLPGYLSAWFGEKYIVTLGDDAIHLFTVDGKYVRKLVQQGRGPNEYLYIMGFCVDQQERYGYLASGEEYICVIDLEKGGIVRKISTDKKVPYELWYSDKDSTLFYVPIDMRDSTSMNCAICCIALDGTLLYALKKNSEYGYFNTPYLWGMNDTLRYKAQLCDTLFLLADTVKIPYCRLVTERPFSITTKSGSIVEGTFENRDLFICVNKEISFKKLGEAIYGKVQPLGYYVLDKSDFSLRKIKGFYIDIFDYTQVEGKTEEDVEFFSLQVAGKKAYWDISALQFKELLKDKLDNPLIPEYVKELYNRLDEEDNPVLLVGDIK